MKLNEIKFEHKMEPMIYNSTQKEQKIICSGFYKDHHFVIKSLGFIPTAYVERKECLDGLDTDELDMMIITHCGITYDNGPNWYDPNNTKNYIGWDYGHPQDHIAYPEDNRQGHKWTTKEILGEVVYVIDQLVDLEEKENDPKRINSNN